MWGLLLSASMAVYGGALSAGERPSDIACQRILSFTLGVDSQGRQRYPCSMDVAAGEVFVLESPGNQRGITNGWLHIIDTTSLVRTMYPTLPMATSVRAVSYSHVSVASPMGRQLQVVDRSVNDNQVHNLRFTGIGQLPATDPQGRAAVWLTAMERAFAPGKTLELVDPRTGESIDHWQLMHVTSPYHIAKVGDYTAVANSPLVGASQLEVLDASGKSVDHTALPGRAIRLRCGPDDRLWIACSNRAGGGVVEYGGVSKDSRRQIITAGRPIDLCALPDRVLILEQVQNAMDPNRIAPRLTEYPIDDDGTVADRSSADWLAGAADLGDVAMAGFDPVTGDVLVLDDRGVVSLRRERPSANR